MKSIELKRAVRRNLRARPVGTTGIPPKVVEEQTENFPPRPLMRRPAFIKANQIPPR